MSGKTQYGGQKEGQTTVKIPVLKKTQSLYNVAAYKTKYLG